MAPGQGGSKPLRRAVITINPGLRIFVSKPWSTKGRRVYAMTPSGDGAVL
jgi:hypothetical protein